MTEVKPGVHVDTPELDRALECNREQKVNDTLTQFVDWLTDNGYVIAVYGRQFERSRKCPECNGTGKNRTSLSPRQTQLLHRGQLPDQVLEDCGKCHGDGKHWYDVVDENSLQPMSKSWERLFADFHDLDLQKMEEEKLGILEAIRG